MNNLFINDLTKLLSIEIIDSLIGEDYSQYKVLIVTTNTPIYLVSLNFTNASEKYEVFATLKGIYYTYGQSFKPNIFPYYM